MRANAIFAAIAQGTAPPMLARPPEREAIIPARICRLRANQLTQEPESLVRMTWSGRRLDGSWKGSWSLARAVAPD